MQLPSGIIALVTSTCLPISDNCPDGEEWVSKDESCSICVVGKYRKRFEDYWCMDCPEGTTTFQIGARSKDECHRGTAFAVLPSLFLLL